MLVAALGFTVLGAGIALLALPGPGVLVIIVGLAILATEFAWAERALDKTLGKASQAAGTLSGNAAGRVLLALSGCALVAAGVVVMVLDAFERVHNAGIGLIVAGVAGLTTLLPPVQSWIAREQAKRDAAHGRD
ncbi:MAG TPA: PGPGW domain-containing protein [Acidimicrobiales bacterium]|nr:PGPGW domain-containing protein [Acidimicrobiales bacterium]